MKTIDPANIEPELQRIWDSLQGTNKMRACLFNLIIYAKKTQRMDYLNQVVQKVIEKFPSRIIFVTYDETCSDEDLKTGVSVLTADEGEHEIVCDLIEIEVCRKDHPRVPFVILPHILPDLPIYLVHADDPTFKNPVAEKLEHLADRIIFDSESTCDLPAFAKAVLSHSERCPADVADLNWARTEGWRQLFATVFKSKDDLKRIKHIKEVNIFFNSQKTKELCHTNIQSIYFQGWLAVQLGWKLKNIENAKDDLFFFYENDFGLVKVTLHSGKQEKISPGRILSIEIKTEEEFRYSFNRSKEFSHHILIETSTPDWCSLPIHYVFDKDVSGQSLVKEICHKGTSAHYTKMLTLLMDIQNESLSIE